MFTLGCSIFYDTWQYKSQAHSRGGGGGGGGGDKRVQLHTQRAMTSSISFYTLRNGTKEEEVRLACYEIIHVIVCCSVHNYLPA